MRKLIFALLSCLYFLRGVAQTDSVAMGQDFSLREGVYKSYSDLRRNNPISKESIVSKEDKTQLDFIGKTLASKKLVDLIIDGGTYSFKVEALWGYFQNNSLYLNFEGKFYRVPVFGAISHFIGTIEVINYMNGYGGMYGGGFYGPGMMMGGGMPVKQREVRQFLFDFYTGDIMDYNLPNVEILISRDLNLYTEFMNFKKKKRREMMMLYVRKYNQLHPAMFPKN